MGTRTLLHGIVTASWRLSSDCDKGGHQYPAAGGGGGRRNASTARRGFLVYHPISSDTISYGLCWCLAAGRPGIASHRIPSAEITPKGQQKKNSA